MLGGFLVVVFMLLLFYAMSGLGDNTGAIGAGQRAALLEPAAAESQYEGDPRPLGNWLFTYHALPFELTSVLLLIAMVGALMVARDTRSEGREHVEVDHGGHGMKNRGGEVQA